jgi:hypothetical protein
MIMGKKQPSPLIGQAQGISAQERGAGQSNIDQGVSAGKTAVSDPTNSPLYKALYTTEAGQMSQAYDTASGNQRAKANAAGFGYSQPTTQGAEEQLRGQQASQIGQLPGKVASQAVPLELQQSGQQIGAGTSELAAGNQAFTQGAVPLEEQYQNYSLNYTPAWQRALQGGASSLQQSLLNA